MIDAEMQKAIDQLVERIKEAVGLIVESFELIMKQSPDLQALLKEFGQNANLHELEDLAVDPAEIIETNKLPRPPKKLGPMKNAYCSAISRPHKRARSNCTKN